MQRNPTSALLRCALQVVAGLSLLWCSTAIAQVTDPCLDHLSDQPEDLEQYDALVGQYLEAQGDPGEQIALLDQLWEVCAQNLRLIVLRADALAEAGQCEDAAREYQWVLDSADRWPHRENADDARDRANEGLDRIRQTCVAQVQVNCGSDGASVQVGERTPRQCPATFELPVGTHEVVVSQEGYETLRREFTFRTGNNFVEIEALTALDRSGSVEFSCGATGTEIAIGPERFGCPATRVLPVGQVDFVAYRPDMEPYTGSVLVEEGGTVRAFIPGGSQQSTGGVLDVTCTPSEARIEVIEAGAMTQLIEQPCPLVADLAPGTYELSVTAEGYSRELRTVELEQGSRTRLSVELSELTNLNINVVAMGGAGLLPTTENGQDVSYTTDGESAGSVVGFVRVLAGIIYALDEINHIAAGGQARLGFGLTEAFFGGGYIDYQLKLESLYMWLGGSGGYGQVGAAPCEQSGSDPDQLFCEDKEEAGAIFGLRFGVGLLLSDHLGILAGMEIMIHEPTIFDLGAGLEYRFF